MKTMIAILASILFVAPSIAGEYTYSKQEPQIQRLQGVVLYPYEIEEVQTEDGVGYKYKLLKLEDIGQVIHQDRGKFATENRRAIARQLYDLDDLIEAQKGDELDSKMTVFAQPVMKLAIEKAP